MMPLLLLAVGAGAVLWALSRREPDGPVNDVTASSGVTYRVRRLGGQPPNTMRVDRGAVAVLVYWQPPGGDKSRRVFRHSALAASSPMLLEAKRDFGVA